MGGRGGGGGAKEMEEGDCRSIGWSRRCSGLVCVCLSLSLATLVLNLKRRSGQTGVKSRRISPNDDSPLPLSPTLNREA